MKTLLNACVFSFLLLYSTASFAAKQTKPQEYQDFTRLTWEQMQDISSKNKLSHRIFYKPSQGPDAKWFDAVKKGDLETVKKMVQGGQNLEAKDTASLNQTALGWAAFIGYLDMVEYLVSKGADLYATDVADVQHSFKSAILGGNIEVINYLYPLMKDKINLNAQDERDDETALMVAADNNRIEAVEFLIANGADVNIVAKKAGTSAFDHNALTYACRKNNKKVVDMLIAAGAINHKTNKPSCD